MSAGECRTFLAEGARTGKLATVRADGRAHVAAVWFVPDGDDVVFMTGALTVKGRNLRRDPRASLLVDDDAPPFSWVRLDGVVEISEEPAPMLGWSSRIAGRYMGEERAEEFGRRNAVPGELLVRLSPTSIASAVGVSD